MSLAHGTLLGGRYRVVRLVGRGGMGAVYEAVDERTRRRVALKVLLGVDGAGVERFRREAEAAAALGHPHIVAMLDFSAGAASEPPFLVMELLEGVSLGGAIDRGGPLSLGRAAQIALQILDALAIAHRSGVIHRDIKPDNVFLTRGPTGGDFVKLLDFGVAKVDASDQAPLTRAGQVLGSPAYMAPEQARGASVDARADLYAVGATMLHALSGRLPSYASGAATSDAPRSLSAAVPLSSLRGDLPPAFSAIVDRAMASDAALRFQSADEMRAALAPWAAGDGPLSQALPSVPLPSVGFSPTLGAPDPHAATIAPITRAPATAPVRRGTEAAPSPGLLAPPSPSALPPMPDARAGTGPGVGPGGAPAGTWLGAPAPRPTRPGLAIALAVVGAGVLALAGLGVAGAVVWTRRGAVAEVAPRASATSVAGPTAAPTVVTTAAPVLVAPSTSVEPGDAGDRGRRSLPAPNAANDPLAGPDSGAPRAARDAGAPANPEPSVSRYSLSVAVGPAPGQPRRDLAELQGLFTQRRHVIAPCFDTVHNAPDVVLPLEMTFDANGSKTGLVHRGSLREVARCVDTRTHGWHVNTLRNPTGYVALVTLRAREITP